MWENNYYLPACLKGGLHVGRTGVSFLKGTGGPAEELEGHGTEEGGRMRCTSVKSLGCTVWRGRELRGEVAETWKEQQVGGSGAFHHLCPQR